MYHSQNNKFWPSPESRTVGFYSDSTLYADVLELASNVEYFTKSDLQNFLVNHVKGLTFILSFSETAIDSLIRELFHFKWIGYYFSDPTKAEKNYQSFSSNQANIFTLSKEGAAALGLYRKDKGKFFDQLIVELHKTYVIPGWFIQRLWDLNPNGQGEVVIPSPPKKWNPVHRQWHDNEWNEDMVNQVKKSYELVDKFFPNSFTLDFNVWLEEIKAKWELIGSAKPRTEGLVAKHVFTPRKRLAFAMKESAVKLLFGNANPVTGLNDFNEDRSPLRPRSYSYWCTRLEEIGLLNYTDYNIPIPGRIIYPVCSFKDNVPNDNFRLIKQVSNLSDKYLCLFRPGWSYIKDLFYETLYEEYKKIYLQVKSLYISIQDLRDSVCRILRLGNFVFDEFIERAVDESLYGNTSIRIALETDVREDQRKSLQRRPVYVHGKFVSLIAITNN